MAVVYKMGGDELIYKWDVEVFVTMDWDVWIPRMFGGLRIQVEERELLYSTHHVVQEVFRVTMKQ